MPHELSHKQLVGGDRPARGDSLQGGQDDVAEGHPEYDRGRNPVEIRINQQRACNRPNQEVRQHPSAAGFGSAGLLHENRLQLTEFHLVHSFYLSG